jgi:hypothetical protein
MRKFTLFTILVFFASLITSTEVAFGEGGIVWGPAGKPVCTASKNQQNIRMVADGSGGAIIVWEDWRSGGQADIYAQRIDRYGNRVWQENGVPVATGTYREAYPVVVSDGYGGAIVAWEDYRYVSYSNIYALRILPTGYIDTSWPATGVALSLVPENQSFPDIADVGSNGIVVTWQQYAPVTYEYSIWAQRTSINGVPQWPTPWGEGVVVSIKTMTAKEFPKIINDGTGYVIVTWQDYRSTDCDIYAQRMDIGIGSTSWTLNGKAVSVVTASDQKNPEIVPDGQGGAIIVWTDYRSGTTAPDIYAQRISTAGAQMWDTNGIPICKEANVQGKPFIMNDLQAGATKGAIIAWEDTRSDTNSDIYAEKVPLDVTSGWTGGGKAMATGNQIQKCPRLVSDNQGGGIITWIENDLISSPYKIFASKRNQDGDPVWSIYPGVLVYKGTEVVDHQIVTDGSLGVIIAWQSGPNTDYNIYAQRVIDDAVMPLSASISGRVTLPDGETGITGVEVWALTKDGELVSSCTTSTVGDYGLTGLVAFSTYTVRAMWTVNSIESSVSMEAVAPSYRFDFTLEIDYFLGTIAGNVSGVEREAKRVSGSGLGQSLSSASGIAFVELEQRGKVIARVPVDTEGNYSIPNLLPGRFIARAYNGTIYSNPRVVNLKEGETLRVDFAFGIMPEETVFNYPNPAKSGSTTIRYYCGYSDPEAEIKIYNISGELVRKVEDNEIDRTAVPIYSFLWDCKNNSGKEIASGIYIYIVEVKEKSGSESKKVTKRMAIIR